jgi:hypothetical protein
MAFPGNQIDHAVRKFLDMLDFELQQRGSRMRGLVRNIQGEGDTVFYDRLGTMGSYIRTSRNEPKQILDQTFERRFITPTTIESNTDIDIMDLIRYASSPQGDLLTAMRAELGRKMDDLIISAMVGNANRQVNNVAGSVAFDTTNQQISDSYIGYTNLSAGTHMLHEGMIIKAKQILQDAEIDMDQEQLYCVGNAKQFGNLASRITQTNIAYRTDMGDLDVPGLDKSIDGMFGVRFIHSTRIPTVATGVGQNTSGNTDDQVLFFVGSCCKLATWQDLNVNVHKRYDLAGNPDEMTCNFSMGAGRTEEKKIVSILCSQS